MAPVSLGLADIVDAALSHAQATGWFDAGVSGHEPKAAPGQGLHCALWVADVRPLGRRSGLASTGAVVTLSVRVGMPMLHEPQDEIDPTVLAAADALMGAYSADFTLGGLVAAVDLLGQSGRSLSGQAGYLTQDHTAFRVFTITLPLLCDDLWEQSP